MYYKFKKTTFLIEKAKKLWLKPGQNYSKLQKGENVILDDGSIIKLFYIYLLWSIYEIIN